MKENIKCKHYLIRESVFHSILSDLFTFACIGGLVFANRYFLREHASIVIDLLSVVFVSTFSIDRYLPGSSKSIFNSDQELAEFVRREYPEGDS